MSAAPCGGPRAGPPPSAGFTLIELLVAVALGLAILVVASDLLISSSRSASDVQGRNELLQESQIAQNYLVGQLREAVYVFPQGTALTLGSSGYATQNPVSGGQTWTVNAGAPIVAFVRPPSLLPGSPDPLVSGSTVGSCKNAAGAGVNDQRACYKFMAYYPVSRSVWVGGATSENRPAEDSANPTRWVLVEYRSNYLDPPSLASLSAAAYSRTGGEARLLLDYVQPPALALPDTPPLFQTGNLGGGSAVNQRPGDFNVTVNLAVSRRIGRRDVTVPGRGASALDSVTTVVVVPRNLGNLPD
ncbi:PilW family protein [Deinococcus koreensis]|uniref:Prepilin-type cleavage/methylation domain-containing protein n=1 Tax=Deinococcus koreensis TaxID=2054903 RepID=A0A2K3UW57_9DEIO|nr:prepilin-type N-terminal cleavage/methylation domain-containing protein [Deinococcus koreensis]PNY80774.1 hypothetical protein CVO96_04780 [Deinococcus koreensis]